MLDASLVFVLDINVWSFHIICGRQFLAVIWLMRICYRRDWQQKRNRSEGKGNQAIRLRYIRERDIQGPAMRARKGRSDECTKGIDSVSREDFLSCFVPSRVGIAKE